MKRFLLLTFLIGGSLILPGQPAPLPGFVACTAEDVINGINDMNQWFLKNKTYSVNIRHFVYASYTSAKVVDADQGYVIKNNNLYHSYLLGVHTIQNDKVKMVVDSSEKVILVTNPDEMNYELLEKKISVEVIGKCKNFKVKISGDGKIYRFDFPPGSMYESLEVGVDKQNHLSKLCYYLREKFPMDKEVDNRNENAVMVRPRLEMIYDSYKMNVSARSEAFDASDYIIFKSNKISLVEKYKNYSLKDLRLKP